MVRYLDLNRTGEKNVFPNVSKESSENEKNKPKQHYSFEFVVEGMPAYKMPADKK